MLIRGRGREESGLLLIKARDVVAANFAGQKLDKKSVLKTPNESLIRGEIYQVRPNLGAIVHAPRQLKAFLMAITEGTYIGHTQKDFALRTLPHVSENRRPQDARLDAQALLIGLDPGVALSQRRSDPERHRRPECQLSSSQGPAGGGVPRYFFAQKHGDEAFFKKLYGK